MATIKQALDILKKAGNYVNVNEDAWSCKSTITIEIPFGISWFDEIEGTGELVDTHIAKLYKLAINTVHGCSSQEEKATYFKNQFSETYKVPEVREIRYNGPATIVFWEDNTKTVVKVQPGELYYDPDKAFAMAVCKKLFGNKFNRHLTKAQKAFKKYYEEACEKDCNMFYNLVAMVRKLFNPSVNNDSEDKKED